MLFPSRLARLAALCTLGLLRGRFCGEIRSLRKPFMIIRWALLDIRLLHRPRLRAWRVQCWFDVDRDLDNSKSITRSDREQIPQSRIRLRSRRSEFVRAMSVYNYKRMQLSSSQSGFHGRGHREARAEALQFHSAIDCRPRCRSHER
ncbi:hypothetical protein FA95DRAFT_1326805 [Auriscalpium vulgare]|uniref:Uncharacterized protein n=1 Tax=Auriscalpium vulgare TaxID=40419 RepID=A0ACB8S9A4_9AGAM|nr:hypothetical protein FA95DRAFT_1326805 [Auriscalpium vulgare]